MIDRAVVDLDGIVTNWSKGMCLIHNRPYAYDNPENYGKFDLDEILGIAPNDFWKPAEFDFWANLEKTEEADEIIRLVIEKFGKDRVAFLSSPSLNLECEKGKKAWLKEHYSAFYFERRYIFTTQKWYCANEKTLLIDDADKNYKAFTEEGGYCFLYPRPWNSRYSENGQGLALLKEYLEQC